MTRAGGLARAAARLALLLPVLGAACGGPREEPAAEEAAAADSVAEEPEEAPEPPVLAGAIRTVGFPGEGGTFAHDAHGRLACVRCHTLVPGHDAHGTVECVECHVPPAGFLAELSPSPEECLACHHGPGIGFECRHCHGPELLDPMGVPVSLELAIWPEPRARDLPFAHVLHESAECRECHEEPVTLGVARNCASCHESHHRVDADCASCHEEPPTEAHGADAHVACGGSGCHADESVLLLTAQREGCLACHAAQKDHEAEGICTECHLLPGRGGPTGPAAEVRP